MDRKDSRSLLSIEEAKELGLPFDDPPASLCSWCGSALEPLGAAIDGAVRWVAHRPCGCDGEAAFEAKMKAEERKRKEAATAGRLKKAGVPRRFAKSTTDNPLIQRWISGFDVNCEMGLYISGSKGSGKTSAASAVARALVYAGYDVVMVEAREMLDDVKATFGSDVSEAAAIRPFLRCDLLIVDELGKESAREWSSNTLFDIVNGRYKDMRPTIFCSQHRLGKLAAHLARNGESETAEAIASRIQETCPEVWLGTVDRRKQAHLVP